MNNASTDIDNWLIESSVAHSESAVPEIWEPIFDPNLHLVHTKFGFYSRFFLRPKGFTKRFYHKVYPLPIENWRISKQVRLYDGFCTFDVTLDIQFQVTLKYALSNMDILSDINRHIKTVYQDLLNTVIEKEILNLSDVTWVQKGVTEIEKRISAATNEMLMVQNIQSQTLCTIKPSFGDFPTVQLAQESVFLSVLKRSFEFNQAKREELFWQEREAERQKLEHKRKQLEQLNREAELDRLKQTQEAVNKRLLLKDKEQQLQAQFELEQQLHLQTLQHENDLKEISLEKNIQAQQKREDRLRMAEQEKQRAALAHQARLQDKELESEIAKYEHQQTQWQESKDKIHAQQIVIEQRQKQRELEAF